jgi:hypothetical protein
LSRLTLKDLEIGLERCSLQGWLYSDTAYGLRWSLEVVGKKHRFGDGFDLAPTFFSESLRIAVDDWTAFENTKTGFDASTSEDEDAGLPTLYLCSYLVLPKSEILFGKREGSRFALEWRGIAEANFSDEYGQDMPFEVVAQVPFEGLEVRFHDRGGDFETQARQLTKAQGLSDGNLVFSGSKRFRDDPSDSDYRLIRAFFKPQAD